MLPKSADIVVIGGGCVGLPPAFAAQDETEAWNPSKPFFSPGKQLKIQPVFMYSLPTRKEAASWKSWGGVQTEPAVAEETARIGAELTRLAKQAEFGLEILPLEKVNSADAALKLIGMSGGTVVGCAFIVDLPDLGGRARLERQDVPLLELQQFFEKMSVGQKV